jgi:hypothetical protein
MFSHYTIQMFVVSPQLCEYFSNWYYAARYQ